MVFIATRRYYKNKKKSYGQNGFFTIWPFGLLENMSRWRLVGIPATCGRDPGPKRQQFVHRGSSSRNQTSVPDVRQPSPTSIMGETRGENKVN